MRRLVQIVRGLISWLPYLLLFLTLYFFLALQTTQGEGCLEIIWSWFTPEPNAMKNVKERSKAFYLSNCVPFCVTISGIHEIFVSSPNWCLTEACAQCNTVKMFSLGEWQTEGEDILNVKETTTRFKKFHFLSYYMSLQTVSTRNQGHLSAVEPKRAFAELPFRDSCDSSLCSTQPTLWCCSPSKVKD